MSSELTYRHQLNALPPEQRAAAIAWRLQGEDGPPPLRNAPWSEVLEQAYRIATPEQREQWCECLLILFARYARGSVWSTKISEDLAERAIWLGAIHFARYITWQGAAQRDMESLLNTWNREASTGKLPEVLINKPLDPAYPLAETDPLTALIQMSSQFSHWNAEHLSELWELALHTQGVAAEKIRAKRCWEIARWVALQSAADGGFGHRWLSPRWSDFFTSLEAAHFYPASLMHFFYLLEITIAREFSTDIAEKHIAQLILSVKIPDNKAQREPLARALDYFGADNQPVREHLYSMIKEPAIIEAKPACLSAIQAKNTSTPAQAKQHLRDFNFTPPLATVATA